MVSDTWSQSDSERGNLLPSFGLSARVLYASSYRQDSTYHGLCYTSWSTAWNEK